MKCFLDQKTGAGVCAAEFWLTQAPGLCVNPQENGYTFWKRIRVSIPWYEKYTLLIRSVKKREGMVLCLVFSLLRLAFCDLAWIFGSFLGEFLAVVTAEPGCRRFPGR